MKTCPWCGRNNLDSDEYCFNCERDLDSIPEEREVEEVEREVQRIRVRKPPSLLRLMLVSLVRKLAFIVLALGAFFIFAMIAIWVSYDNAAVALAAVALLGLAVLVAFYYPDIYLSRRIGTRGALVSLLTNALLLGILLPPTLIFLSGRGYISGAWDFLTRTWWALAAFLVLGFLLAWLVGRRAAAETAWP